MNKKYIVENKYLIQDKSFHETRRWLLSQTLFIYKLVRYLRHKLHIPLDGFSTDKEALAWERERKTILEHSDLPKGKGGNKSQSRLDEELTIQYTKNKQEVFKPIYETIDKFPQLQLEFMFLRGLVLGYKDCSNEKGYLSSENQVYLVQSFQAPLAEFGIYIKYAPWLSDKELLALKKKAQDYYNYMFHNGAQAEKRKRDDLSKDSKYFLAVEHTSITAYVELPNYYKVNFNMKEVFDIVATALKVNEGVIRKTYYRVQKKFYLPNITEVSKIPTL